MDSFLFIKEDMKKIESVITSHSLCDCCIGRIFSEKKENYPEVGREIREKLKKEKISPDNCWLCNGITNEIDEFTELIEDKLEEYEFSTFLIGSKVDGEIIEKEDELIKTFSLSKFEPLKMEINREVGKRVEMDTRKTVSFTDPDIVAMIDTRFNHVLLQIKPIYIYGRYIKKIRGIPQTKWPCRICKGKGCRRCNFTGKMYEESVEELIAKRILDATGGDDESFHGCGREDIDALMLGNGRPFVIEIKNPKRRSINLKSLEKQINKFAAGKVEVRNIRFSNKDEIIRLKNSSFVKVYRAKIIADKDISKEKLNEVVHLLRNRTIKQITPSRVAHRRAMKIRERRIYECKVLKVGIRCAVLEIRADSGTYIKELVSGDDGRTQPNISDMLGRKCKVEELDVVAVEGE